MSDYLNTNNWGNQKQSFLIWVLVKITCIKWKTAGPNSKQSVLHPKYSVQAILDQLKGCKPNLCNQRNSGQSEATVTQNSVCVRVHCQVHPVKCMGFEPTIAVESGRAKE